MDAVSVYMKAVVQRFSEGMDCMTEGEIRSMLREDRSRGEQALFEKYYSYVYAITFRKIHDYGTLEDVEECVIDVFVEVFRRLEDIQPGSLKAYIGTTAKHKASNVCRTLSARMRQTESLEESLASGEDVAAAAEQSEQIGHILDAIAALGEPGNRTQP